MSNLALLLPVLLLLAVVLRSYLLARESEQANEHLQESMDDALDDMDWQFPFDPKAPEYLRSRRTSEAVHAVYLRGLVEGWEEADREQLAESLRNVRDVELRRVERHANGEAA